MRNPSKTPLLVAALALVAGLAVASCKEEEEGSPTMSVCPQMQTLTYQNFGQSFFFRYCNRCHAKTVTGAARMAAPADHTFDTLAEIKPMAEHIDEHAAAGPAAVNTEMPPGEPKPTEAERRQLGEWLACGAP